MLLVSGRILFKDLFTLHNNNLKQQYFLGKGTVKVQFHLGFHDSGVKKRMDRQNEQERERTDNTGEEKKKEDADDKFNVHDGDTIPVAIQKKLYAVLDGLRLIDKAQQSYRIKEMKFRGIAVSINNRVFFWAIVQLLLMLGTGWWQMKSLKNFFVHKKLV